MENAEVRKENKKIIRLTIGICLVVISCATGLISGIQIAKNTTPSSGNNQGSSESNNQSINESNSEDKSLNTNDSTENQYFNELINILKEGWMSEIFYGVSEVDEDLLIRQFVGALSSSETKLLDPFTYLIKEEDPILVPALGKLGITLTNFYNIPVITEIDSRGTAKGILKPGDIIVTLGKVNQFGSYNYVNLTDPDVTFSNMFDLGLGRPGQKQYIKVARFDEQQKLSYHEFEIKLGNPLETRQSYLLEEDIDDTIMVKLTSFVSDNESNQGTAQQLETILKNNPSTNIVLDLRNNGGGSLISAMEVSDLFLPKNKLVTTLEFKNNVISEYTTSDNTAYEFDNIVILQNENTASASEILISALSYHLADKVTLVGTKSYGKGIAQRKVKVFDGAYTLQYTAAKWYNPDGSWLGMTTDSNTDVGFYPLDENMISTSYMLALMDYCSYYMRNYSYYFFKEDSEFLAFKEDNVAIENQFFFEIYNYMYNTSVRSDSYFDSSCTNAIKDYQAIKGISETGEMNLDTLVHFTNEYYMEDNSYRNSFIDKAKDIIDK